MVKLEHSFDVKIAEKYGINCAIILKDIYFWVKKNIANEKHFYDGMHWTYNSIKAFEEMYPYLSKNQIAGALKKLKDEELIVEGNYNRTSFDRTKWYALTEKGFLVVENHFDDIKKEEIHFLKSEMESQEIQNGKHENQKPIPYTITDNNITDNNFSDSEREHDDVVPISATEKRKRVDEMFERLWQLYPRKMGKAFVKYKARENIYDNVGEEQFVRCINRFKDASKGTDMQYIMYGSTFFNTGYEDFLDINYGQTNNATGTDDECLPFR